MMLFASKGNRSTLLTDNKYDDEHSSGTDNVLASQIAESGRKVEFTETKSDEKTRI